MNITKNKILFLFVISAFLVLVNASCTRKVNPTSIVTLSLPSGIGSSKITSFEYSEPMSMQSVSAQEEGDGAEWNPALNPASIADVNCYMVLVAGPEADMSRNTCATTTGQNLKVGRWSGGIPSGTTISVEVPSGSQREITVVGFKASAGACTNFKNSDVSGSSLSEPHILGRIVKDLSVGSVAVSIPITVNGNTLKIDDCAGPDFNFENAPLYFGDATTGTTTVSTSTSYSSLGGVSYQVTAFESEPTAPNEAYTFIQTSGTPTGINANDEIMISNPAQDGTWINYAGEPSIGPCGYRMWDGRYAFARVAATNASGIYIHKGTFMDKLNWNPITGQYDAALKTTINSNLVASPTASGTFCKMRISKVLHYWDLTLQSGVEITSDMFEMNMNSSGILPIRVANNLTLEDGSKISATGFGFMPSSTKHGTGVKGSSLVSCTGPFTSNTGSGGSCAPSDGSGNGAGGGGHGNLSGSPFGMSGGIGGGGSQSGGGGAGEDCGDGSCFGTLSYKIFMGGAGGSAANVSAGTAGAGGGIVYLMAKNINLATNATVTIENNGAAGGGNSTITNQGASGGGAGGSIFVGFGNLNAPGTSILYAVAMGGGGGSAIPTGASGGGGGAGGRIHLMGCNTSLTPITDTTKVYPMANGGTGGGSVASSVGGIGLAGSIVKASVPCN